MNQLHPGRLAAAIRLMFALAALTILAQGVASAQTDTGRIAGIVSDQAGALVSGATVIAHNERTGEERTVATASDGQFLISSLRPATYTVTVNAPNFTETKSSHVQVLVGQELSLNLTLMLTGVTGQVTVESGSDPAINSDSAAMGANVNPREVQALPLNGRQLSQLYLQAPGSVNSGSGTFGDIRFNGRAVEQNIVRYDGIEGTAVIDASPGNLNGEVPSPFRLQSSLENVQEFRVDSSNFPAEFGTGTGGQISVVTKSGGNDFHGSVFEYLRNDALDAANFFDNILGKKAPLKLNQFGGSVGGPILKNRTFFFFSYEGYRLSAGINSIEAVPGAPSRICAPAPGGVPCVEADGRPSRTLLLLPAFRAPNASIISTGAGSNLFDVAQVQASASVNETAYAFRLDHKLTPSNSLYFRYFRDQGTNDQPEGVSGRRVNFVAVPQNAVFGIQSILKPTVLNEFKIGFNGAFTRTNGVAPTINGIDISRLAINISGNTANFAIAGQGTAAGTSNPGGLIRANSATNGRGQPYTVYSLSFIDNLNWTRGNHNYKFGVEFRPSRIYTDRLGGTTYVFNNLTDFLANRAASIQYQGDLSDPSPFNGGVTGNRLAKQEYYIGFAQDEWKIRPNLTLNFGLRYEYYTPLREADNRDVLFNTITGTLDPPTRAFFKSARTNFAPRIALTWSPAPSGTGFFGGGHTLLRGGFGIYYGPGQTEDQIQPIEIDRISSTVSNSAFDTNLDAFVNAVRTNFINNPSNRVYQPRAYAPEYTIPEKVYSYTFSVQQELPYRLIATVAYVGSQGRNLFLRGLTNTLRPGQASIIDGSAFPTNAGVINRLDATGRVIGVTSVRQFDIINNPALCGASASNPICRPYAEIDTKTSGGSDSYNALQVTLARRFSAGLTLNAQYTFARSFGTTSGSNEARTAAEPFGADNGNGDFNNYEADRGYNSFDVRHTYNLSAVYTLPIGDGNRFDFGRVGNALFGDLEIGAIINGRSGLPIDITVTRPEVVIQCTNAAAGCTAGEVRALPGTVSRASPLPAGFTAVINSPGGGASRQTRRPDLIPGVNPYLGNDRQFLNPAAFAIPAPGAFGNLPRNALKGPDFRQVDFVLNKRIRFSETRNIEFRTELFNVFNRANFGNPASTLNNALGTGANQLQPGQPFTQAAASSTFGLLRSTVSRDVGLGTNRQIQFALRFNF